MSALRLLIKTTVILNSAFLITSCMTSSKQEQLESRINIQDDKDSILNWQKNYAQTFPVLSDEKGLISVDFGVTGTPETFVINPNGIVRFRIAGEVHQQGLLNFVHWLSEHPNADQTESLKAFSNRGNPANASI